MDAFLKFLKPQPKASINRVAERFQHLFEAHNLDVSQIPRLVPQITYDNLASPAQLLKALTPAVIDVAANLFGVRSQWLQGQEDTVYDRIWAIFPFRTSKTCWFSTASTRTI